MTMTSNPPPALATILAVTSGKGGVGKTNVTVNVGAVARAARLPRRHPRCRLRSRQRGRDARPHAAVPRRPPAARREAARRHRHHRAARHSGDSGQLGTADDDDDDHVAAGEAARRARRVPPPAGLPAHRHRGRHFRQRDRDAVSGRARRARHLARAVRRRRCLRHREGADADLAGHRDRRRRQRRARRRRSRPGVQAARCRGEPVPRPQPRYYGFIAEDRAVRDSVLVQRAVVDHLPQAVASRCFRILASRLAGLGRGPGGLRLAVGATLRRPSTQAVPRRFRSAREDVSLSRPERPRPSS